MIKNVVIVGCIFTTVLLGCGETPSAPKPAAEEAVEVEKDENASNPDYKAGLALVAQNNCLTCHQIKETITGPAYVDVAAKYAGADDAQITRLAKTIIAGGSGNWGTIPMIPHPDVTEENAKKMVKYILLLKK